MMMVRLFWGVHVSGGVVVFVSGDVLSCASYR